MIPDKGCLLSIIVPFYNNDSYLEASLTSLFDQIGEDIEVVLVNDGSTDRSADVVKQVIQRYAHPHLVLITQQNGGIACARNVGLQHASGQYITFLDGDDLLSSDYLSTLRPILQSNAYELIDFDYQRFANTLPVGISTAPSSCSAYNMQQGLICLLPLFTRSMWHLWNRVFRRTLLEGETFATGRRYEDVIFTPFIYFKTHKIAHLDRTLYFYRDNNQGITRNIREKDIADMLFAMKKMLNFAAQNPQDEAIKSLAAQMVLNCFEEVKSMSKQVYGYYYYPSDVRATLKKAAALCSGSSVPRKKIIQMRYTQLDTLFSRIRKKRTP